MSGETSINFGTLIKRLRKEKGLSLRQLANEVNISPSYLHRIESGERNSPTLKTVFVLADFLGVSVQELKNSMDLHYDEPENLKFEQLLLSYNNIIIKDKKVDTNFKEKLLNLVDLITTSNNQLTTNERDQNLITNAIKELRKSYQTL